MLLSTMGWSMECGTLKISNNDNWVIEVTERISRHKQFPDYVRPKDNPPLRYVGPTGFHWLINGLLGGTPRPGIVRDVEHDVEALQRLNTKLLITLNENWTPPVAILSAHGITSHQVKITDMHAPTFEQALDLCDLVDGYLAEDRACIYHCRAGQGRTGTMLAAQLIYYGENAETALAEVRSRNHKWIESQAQVEFLTEFQQHLQNL